MKRFLLIIVGSVFIGSWGASPAFAVSFGFEAGEGYSLGPI